MEQSTTRALAGWLGETFAVLLAMVVGAVALAPALWCLVHSWRWALA